MSRYSHLLIYINGFVVGFALMGFEMLGSRYLYPYYGGSIETWAALISTVLLALMIGYFFGGIIVDKFPSISLLGIIISISAIYLALIPKSANRLIELLIGLLGDGPLSVLIASLALLLIPLSLLGAYSPFAIRLILREHSKSGRISGLIYATSTMGNIIGTLITTFYLIPNIGTRLITYIISILVGSSGISLILFSFRSRRSSRNL